MKPTLPRVYKTSFLCLTQLSMEFQLLIKTKMLKSIYVSCLKQLTRCTCIYPAYKC